MDRIEKKLIEEIIPFFMRIFCVLLIDKKFYQENVHDMKKNKKQIARQCRLIYEYSQMSKIKNKLSV